MSKQRLKYTYLAFYSRFSIEFEKYCGEIIENHLKHHLDDTDSIELRIVRKNEPLIDGYYAERKEE